MAATVALKLTSGRDELAAIIDAVEDLGRRERWPDALLFRVNLALEELGLNIMDYGYDGGPCDIDIVLTSDDDAVTIEIIDGGPPSIPSMTPRPQTSTPPSRIDASAASASISSSPSWTTSATAASTARTT